MTAGCGGLFSGPTGVLKSPGHPGPYPRNQDCVYVIRRPDTDRVTLAFHELDLEKTDHCVADSLEIRDGDSEKAPVRYRGCGSNMPMEVIRSFSSAFWIRFTSDEADTAGGFKITYTADPALRRQFFLLSHQQSIDIKHVGEGGSMALPIPGLYNPVALEFDPRQRRVYWSDQGIGEIRSAFLNGTDWKTEYTHTGDDFSAVLALDPMARLVFFGNLFQGTVVMRSLDTGHHRTVLSGLGLLASLVLDYSDGTLFWVESSVLSSSISRSLYDGSQRRQIVTRHLGEPRCLALDREHKRLYWVDLRHEKVEWSDYEGKGRSSQVATFQGTYFFAIVVSPTHLHVLDWGNQGRYSKYSVVHQIEKDGSNDTALFAVMHRISDLHFLDDAAWKAETNGCGREEGRGGCSHLCIPLSGQGDVRCVCPDRFLLSADHKTCTPLTGNEQSIRGGNYYHADFEDQDDLDDEDDDEAVITLYSALKYLAEKTSVQYEEYIGEHTKKSNLGPRKSLTEPQGERKSLTEPHGQRKSLTEPLEQRKSLTEPHEQRKSLTELHEQRKSLTEPHGQSKSLTKPHGQRKSLTEPHTQRKSLTKPHTQRKSLTEPHGQRKSLTEPHGQRKSLTEPHGQRKSLTEPHTQRKSLTEPHGQRKSLTEPHGQRKSLTEPHGQRKSLTEPHGQRKSLTEPHGQRKSLTEPHGQRKSLTEPHGQRKSLMEPHGQRKSLTEPLGQRKSLTEPHGQRKSLTELHGQRKSLTEPHGQRKSLTEPHIQRKSLTEPHGQRKSPTEPHGQRKSLTEPYDIVISKDDLWNRPITAQVSLTGPRPFETDGSKVMPVTCQYEGKGIRSWRSAQCVELKDKVCLLQPKVPDDDGKEIMCEVHFMDGSYGRAAFTIRLNYPPQEPPRIKGYNSGQILKTGDNLHMSCVVHGGKPLVSSVDFYCPGHLDTEPDVESRTYVQASVTIDRLTSSHDGVTCVCSAEWKVPEMYAEKAYVTLRVVSREKTEL